MVLSVLALVTVIVVALLTVAKQERSSAGMLLETAQANILAQTQMQIALGTISDAIAEGSQPGKTWASEPGRIWIFDIAAGTGLITQRSVNLFSALPGPDPDNVDLNRPSLNGTFPIAWPTPGQTEANMKVGWNYVLRDPSRPASGNNPVLGRIAYWVDDESCKVNINTADGSQRNATPKEMEQNKKYSFGFGTPSEISLAALPGLDKTKAGFIADYAWEQEFNSAEEITRAKDASGSQVVTRPEFETLRFDVTHYNSSPDLNFMGEPRINLQFRPIPAAGATPRKNPALGPLVNTQANGGTGIQGLVLDHIYPQPSQLPLPIYPGLPGALSPPTEKLFLHTSTRNAISTQLLEQGQTGTVADDFYVGRVITKYLTGFNLKGTAFTWPKFEGASSSGFAGKYTPRQLDSITLQILDIAGKITFCDQVRNYTFPGIMDNGWLSNQPVMGVARVPQITELLVKLTATLGDPFNYGTAIPLIQFRTTLETYFPKGYKGSPQHTPCDTAMRDAYVYEGAGWNNTELPGGAVNFYDAPRVDSSTGAVRAPSKMGGYWMDEILTFRDQNGKPAGVDLMGNPKTLEDPDQAKAALYHPYCLNAATGKYMGSKNTSSSLLPTGMLQWRASQNPAFERSAGCYSTSTNNSDTTLYPAKPGATSLRLVGGVQYWLRYGNNYGYILPVLYPFDSAMPELISTHTPSPRAPCVLTSAQKSALKDQVIPIDLTIPIPGTDTLLVRSADPLVSQFPKDWELIVSPASSEITMQVPATAGANAGIVYMKGGKDLIDKDPCFPRNTSVVTKRPNDFDGDNIRFRPSGGGDPLSVWLPNQDNRIPKQARLPSVGALFAVRTGVFPDKNVASLNYVEQHGVPFRGLNMSPSTQASQATDGGTSYPDWAMLDLFNVPFLPQKPYGPGTSVAAVQPFRRLTYGGATVGRMNINNPEVPYPFSEATAGVAQTPPKRNALKALFEGLTPSRTYDSSNEPVFTTIDASTSAVLAQAVAKYQKQKGPFFMAGQIANVPEVAAYLYTFNGSATRANSISRNDLVRDTMGAITTRSNVYTIWVVAQTIRKNPGNTRYDVFEKGDRITSEVRRRYLVERFIDTGADGVPGNAGILPATSIPPNSFTTVNPDGDPATPARPVYQPSLSYPLRYLWRVVAVENLQL